MNISNSKVKLVVKNNTSFLIDGHTQFFWILKQNPILHEILDRTLNLQEIKKLLSKKKDDNSASLLRQIQSLEKYNFFVDKIKTKQKNNHDTSIDVTQIYINPSTNCNLNCWYCYSGTEKKHKTEPLSFEEVTHIIHAFLNYKKEINSIDPLGISIGYTEEITLNFQLFKSVKDFIEEIQSSYDFPIFLFVPSSNLMEITDDFVDFINEYKYLTVSLDLDNKQQIQNAIHNLTKFNKDVRKHLIFPIHSQTKNILEKYLQYSSYFDYVSLRPVRVGKNSKHPWSSESLANLKIEISKFFHQLLNLNDKELYSIITKFGPTDYFARYIHRIIQRTRIEERCSAGKKAFAINSELKISPCSSLLNSQFSTNFKKLEVSSAIRDLQKTIPDYMETKCTRCYIHRYCGGPCLDWITKMDLSEFSFNHSLECDLNKHIFEEGLFFVAELIAKRRTSIERYMKDRKLRNRLNYPFFLDDFTKIFN